MANVELQPESQHHGAPTPADHFRALVESSEDAILSKDANAVITSWNPAAERLYGYSAAEAIGQPISILIPEHRRNEEKKILAKILAGERVTHYETERRHKDGRIVTVSLTVSPIEHGDGEIVGASVVARDVTRRRQARERAERVQAMTETLSREITPERTVEILLNEGVAALGADAATIGLVDPAGEQVELAGSVGYSEEGLAGWERFHSAPRCRCRSRFASPSRSGAPRPRISPTASRRWPRSRSPSRHRPSSR